MMITKQQLMRMDISVLPGRKIPPKSQALTGRLCLRDGTLVPFESMLERDCLIKLDFDVPGRNIRSQPFTIAYKVEDRAYRYTPDVIAEFAEHEQIPVTVIEIKPRDVLEKKWSDFELRFNVIRELCRRNQWNFEILTEEHIRFGANIENILFLRRYLDLPVDPSRALMILDIFNDHSEVTADQILYLTCPSNELRSTMVWILWVLVANKVLTFDMNYSLRMDTPLKLTNVSSITHFRKAVDLNEDETTVL